MTESSAAELSSEKTNELNTTNSSFKLVRVLSMIIISILCAIISYQSYPTYSLDNIHDSVTFSFDGSLNVNNAHDRSLQMQSMFNRWRKRGGEQSNVETHAFDLSGKLNPDDVESMDVSVVPAERAFERFFQEMKQEKDTFTEYVVAGLEELNIKNKLAAGANTGVIICTVLEVTLNAIFDPTQLLFEAHHTAEAVFRTPKDVKENEQQWTDVINGIIDRKAAAKQPLVIRGSDNLLKLASVVAFICSAACPPVAAIAATTATVLFVIKYTAVAVHWLYQHRTEIKHKLFELKQTLRDKIEEIKRNKDFKGDKEVIWEQPKLQRLEWEQVEQPTFLQRLEWSQAEPIPVEWGSDKHSTRLRRNPPQQSQQQQRQLP